MLRIRNYTPQNILDVINHPCPNLSWYVSVNGGPAYNMKLTAACNKMTFMKL